MSNVYAQIIFQEDGKLRILSAANVVVFFDTLLLPYCRILFLQSLCTAVCIFWVKSFMQHLEYLNQGGMYNSRFNFVPSYMIICLPDLVHEPHSDVKRGCSIIFQEDGKLCICQQPMWCFF